MKKTIKILLICFALLTIFSSICMASGTMPITNDSQEDDKLTIEGPNLSIANTDLYLAEDNLVIENFVNGNVFAIGKTVTIKGKIYGDLFVMGEKVIIEEAAVITNNVFTFASDVTVNGTMNDMYAFASNFTLGSNAYINRDLKLYAGNVNFEGIVKKDVYMETENINFPTDAKKLIGGNLIYTSPSELAIPEGVVLGDVRYEEQKVVEPSIEQIITNYIVSFINVLVYAIVVILLCTFCTPKFASKATYCMVKKPFATAGIGILSIIVIPIIAILLTITGYASYVGIALFAMYILVLSITISILGMAIGNYFNNKLKEKTKTKFTLLSITAVAILWALQQVPYIGSYVSLFTVVFGLGIFVFTLFIRKDVNELQETPKKDK